ncbi:uncharacterized protein LOC126606681 isoform X1 [Malus sylvestris]|uniref:uncharacterized protein LOC126606681 isoform X1 n=1 Tax=Malus sylvestris TaxID=3752 RepID=UPI0021AD41F6|nr:uncharacterized protein LOC126606681 isoform X1 [Malus sylvestris]
MIEFCSWDWVGSHTPQILPSFPYPVSLSPPSRTLTLCSLPLKCTDKLQNHPKLLPTTELRPPSNSWNLHDHDGIHFRLKQDHSELSEVPRKLGVLRWKFLDVRTRRSTSSKFGRSFRGIFRRIPGELGVEAPIVMTPWRIVLGSCRANSRFRNHKGVVTTRNSTVF